MSVNESEIANNTRRREVYPKIFRKFSASSKSVLVSNFMPSSHDVPYRKQCSNGILRFGVRGETEIFFSMSHHVRSCETHVDQRNTRASNRRIENEKRIPFFYYFLLRSIQFNCNVLWTINCQDFSSRSTSPLGAGLVRRLATVHLLKMYEIKLTTIIAN